MSQYPGGESEEIIEELLHKLKFECQYHHANFAEIASNLLAINGWNA
jgi:hypothetical protein